VADHKGDKGKQPPECNDGSTSCPNIKNTYESMSGERWRCEVCGESFWLDYDDMQ
jgi:hypothetical protein